MEKFSPTEIRKNLEVMKTLKDAGVDFVPMPVLSPVEKQLFIKLLNHQLAVIGESCDEG